MGQSPVGKGIMERYDLSVHRGATFHKIMRIKRNGEPLDLTGYAAKCQVRMHPDGGELLAEVSTEIVPLAGRVDLLIPSSVTSGFESGIYVWDIRLTSPDSIAEYYVGGKFSVLPSVTE